MSWCPECKNEYVDGMAICADCGCALVKALEDENVSPLIFGEKEQMDRILDFLQYSKFQTANVRYSEAEDVYQLYVSKAEQEKAYRAVGIYLEQEGKSRKEEEEIQEQVKAPTILSGASGGSTFSPAGYYQASAKKAEDFKSSAYTLLIVGGIGIIALVLYYFDILPFSLSGVNQYMVYGVMGALFVLFIVMGILSFKSSRKYASKAKTEDNLTKEILGWCREQLTQEFIDRDLFDDGEEQTEEIKYFKRCERMRILVNEKFLNLEEGYVEELVDEYYQEVYDA